MGLINNWNWGDGKSDLIDYLFGSGKNAFDGGYTSRTGSDAYTTDLALIKELIEKYGLSESQVLHQ